MSLPDTNQSTMLDCPNRMHCMRYLLACTIKLLAILGLKTSLSVSNSSKIQELYCWRPSLALQCPPACVHWRARPSLALQCPPACVHWRARPSLALQCPPACVHWRARPSLALQCPPACVHWRARPSLALQPVCIGGQA